VLLRGVSSSFRENDAPAGDIYTFPSGARRGPPRCDAPAVNLQNAERIHCRSACMAWLATASAQPARPRAKPWASPARHLFRGRRPAILVGFIDFCKIPSEFRANAGSGPFPQRLASIILYGLNLFTGALICHGMDEISLLRSRRAEKSPAENDPDPESVTFRKASFQVDFLDFHEETWCARGGSETAISEMI